ncbi:tRNA-dihydrouridine synthase [Desulfosarcina alkanivorans]|jgi:nifR3 family TIM-barrel protein|uniref:tRNA-dihydrouridine synthase n=1 Tax=Desulfosarcina alkanivorans TaxID=571177 RepID=A0A5K7YRJ2_9BACT|nr:tRNA dihydrouridine synthase DusB [Desulfosarcina alkanivorans]BBO70529.1 tRNA-dihydrouridine synthase [Desulfosarcina alkanivorans]
MKIGTVETSNFTVLAPLAGITNLPMRLLAKSAGCGLVCSEMISSNGLVYGSGKTVTLLDSIPDEKPLSVQIFGSDPQIMADAARIVQDSGADIVDINFGCSVKKILKSNSGSALMKDPVLARRILESVRQAITIPLTIKIRTGWEPTGKQAMEIARLAQDCGVDAITVHPRTATQGFRGEADWSVIRAIKKVLKLPVIGNGDVTTPADALRMRHETGCDGVMVGRAAIGNPMIFAEILAAARGLPATAMNDGRRIDMMLGYLRDSVHYLGEKTACRMMRSRLCWFVKGMRNAGQFRNAIRFIASEQEAADLIRRYADSISACTEN